MSDLLINVRQISNYPSRTASDGTETTLLQIGGLGGPYQSIKASTLVSTALINSSLGVGVAIPSDAVQGQVFADALATPSGGWIGWNTYDSQGGVERYWTGGPAAALTWFIGTGLYYETVPPGAAGQAIPGTAWQTQWGIDLAGNMRLPMGTLTVARDPQAPMEVATMNWVSGNTVASWNGQTGAVNFAAQDIYGLLGLPFGSLVTQDQLAALAPIDSPSFTGTPYAPTPDLNAANGELVNADWVRQYITYIEKGGEGIPGEGTVTKVSTGAGLSGGPIQSEGTIVADWRAGIVTGFGANLQRNASNNTLELTGLAASAYTDTTNASNITSGSLNVSRLPNIPAGLITGLSSSATTDATNAANITQGTLALARLPFIPVSQITGLVASATTDTTNASNITAGTLDAARLPAVTPNPSGTFTLATVTVDSMGRVTKAESGSAGPGGGITSITAGAGLTGGTITTSGQTIAALWQVPQGIITSVSGNLKIENNALVGLGGESEGSMTGPAGPGDLTGYFPNPTVSKTNGVAFANSATIDTTNAINVTSGVFHLDRIPTIPTSKISGLAASATTDATNADNITSGVLALGRLPTIPPTQISGLAPSATIDTTNANNITAGTISLSVLPSIPSSQISGLPSPIGTVTSVGTGAGLTGGPISTSGTIVANWRADIVTSIDANTMAVTAGVLSSKGGSGPGSLVIPVSDTPPQDAADGSPWFNSGDLQGYIRYNDGNSVQWVPFINQRGLYGGGGGDGTYVRSPLLGNQANRMAVPQPWFSLGSLTLQPGDWDVSGDLWLDFQGSAGASHLYICSAHIGLAPNSQYAIEDDVTSTGTYRLALQGTLANFGGTVPVQRLNISVATPVYLVLYLDAQGTPAVTAGAVGRIRARRWG